VPEGFHAKAAMMKAQRVQSYFRRSFFSFACFAVFLRLLCVNLFSLSREGRYDEGAKGTKLFPKILLFFCVLCGFLRLLCVNLFLLSREGRYDEGAKGAKLFPKNLLFFCVLCSFLTLLCVKVNSDFSQVIHLSPFVSILRSKKRFQ
jgi:hypothetical protein